jgi:hypothetical protein
MPLGFWRTANLQGSSYFTILHAISPLAHAVSYCALFVGGQLTFPLASCHPVGVSSPERFSAGKSFQSGKCRNFAKKGGRWLFGVSLCENAWHASLGLPFEHSYKYR